MHRKDRTPARGRAAPHVRLSYALDSDAAQRPVHHPLFALLDAVHVGGSVLAAAGSLGFSYRHVWGELKRWELELDRALIVWNKGQRATLTPFGEKLMWAERRAQARLAPQIDSLRMALERAFAEAFDDRRDVLSVCTGHDEALLSLHDLALTEHLHLDLEFTGSLQALEALDSGRCALAGFHVLEGTSRDSVSARVYRARLDPARHQLIGLGRRRQGLMLPPGNPRGVSSLRDLGRADLRWVGRPEGSGTRVLLQDLAAQAGIEVPRAFALVERSHALAAQAVASGAADVAFGLEGAARDAGLDFVPLATERHGLVTLQGALDQPAMQRLVALLGSPAWHRTVSALPGHEAVDAGDPLSLTGLLPWWS